MDSAEVPHGPDADVERAVLGDCARVHLLFLNQESEFDPYAGQADPIILWHHLRFGADLFARLARSRIIVRNGVRYDNVDIHAAADRLGPGAALRGVNDGEAAHVAGLEIKGVAGAHETIERDVCGCCRFLGYGVRFGEWTACHAGDTLAHEGLAETLSPSRADLALLPISGRRGGIPAQRPAVLPSALRPTGESGRRVTRRGPVEP